jgi:hypothetical protein
VGPGLRDQRQRLDCQRIDPLADRVGKNSRRSTWRDSRPCQVTISGRSERGSRRTSERHSPLTPSGRRPRHRRQAGASPPSCSSAAAAANARGALMFVPGGRDPAVGALDARDAELVDVADERIGDAAHSRQPLVVGPDVLVLGADNVANIVHCAAGDTAPEHLGRPRRLLPKMLSPCRVGSSPP